MNLISIDQKLVNRLQTDFPLTSHPYADVGSGLGISEAEVIAHIEQLKASGIIRQISPVLNARRLGYMTTLVAMRVDEKQVDKAARLFLEHPGISHAYERDHHFNLWFTLAAPAASDIEAGLPRMAELMQAENFFTLPTVRFFKLRAYFTLGGNGHDETPDKHQAGVPQQKARLSPADRMVINELQQDLPLVPQPFAPMSSRLGMDSDKFLSRCQSLKQRGVIRRFGASVNHRKAGFTANAMTCWAAPPEKVETAGRKLSLLREVSHCYERKTNPLWRHNLFAMIHGHTREACREIADKVSAETGLTDYVTLFSTREFKKTRIKYLV